MPRFAALAHNVVIIPANFSGANLGGYIVGFHVVVESVAGSKVVRRYSFNPIEYFRLKDGNLSK